MTPPLRKRSIHNQKIISLRLSALGHVVQRVGIPHCFITCCRPLFSVTYNPNMFGTLVAYSSYVAQGTEAFQGGRNEEKAQCLLNQSRWLTRAATGHEDTNCCCRSLLCFLH